MLNLVTQSVLYLLLLIVLAVPLGIYMQKAMEGQTTFLSRVFSPIENFILKVLHVSKNDEMGWKQYAWCVILFSLFGFIVVFGIHMLQGYLPGNPEHLPGTTWDLAFNNAVSFVTNTNWQAYSGESTLSYFTQAIGLTVQNFVSAATGIAVLFALVRGFTKVQSKVIGSFWVDITRAVVHILLPLNLILALALIGGGVIENMSSHDEVQLLEPIAVAQDGTILNSPTTNIDVKNNIVTVDGKVVDGAKIIEKEFVPMGPAASQVAIKQTGTNGGGYMGVNSAHPMENPSPFTNLLEMLSILLIPAALCFSFGRAIRNNKQGIAIFLAMFICLCIALLSVVASEQVGTKVLSDNEAVVQTVQDDSSSPVMAGGNMEGKETRFGIVTSSTWGVFTTAASNGSVNSMHDSYTPIGGMVLMLLMQLGEVIFGGVGCGLYGMLGFAILTVFIAGLMVGRTPEFLGKKIEPYDMKWTVVVCLATPFAILILSAIAAMVPSVMDSLNNSGPHGFSEMLYAYSSGGGNNGSAFAGFNADTPFLNVTIGITMILARFLPIVGCLAIAGNLASKKTVAQTEGTLSTTNGMFIFLLIVIVLLIGALSFLPALCLGPIAEFFSF